MINSLLDPVVLFFVLGALSGFVKSDLRVPRQLYDSLTIYLLVSIGLQGGVKLSGVPMGSILLPIIATVFLGGLLAFIAYSILRFKFDKQNAAAIGGHYGSISIVTFAVATSFLAKQGISYEGFMTVLLVIMEIPGIIIGVMLAKGLSKKTQLSKVLHEIFVGKSVYLMLGGLLIGFVLGESRIAPISFMFFDLFKGALAFFLLEMGIVVSHRFSDLKKAGWFLVAFGTIMPIIGGCIAIGFAKLLGFSVGGAFLFAVLGASASYLAATASMRIAIPEANPTFYVTSSLAITFPFNVIVGIPIYLQIAQMVI